MRTMLRGSTLLYSLALCIAIAKGVNLDEMISSDLQQTDLPVLLRVEGQPGLINDFQYGVLEDIFVETFNSLAQKLCPDSMPIVNSAAIERYGNSALPGDGTVTRAFILSSYISTQSGSPLFSTSSEIAVRRHLTKGKKPLRLRGLSYGGGKGSKGSRSKSGTSPSVVYPTAFAADDSTRTDCPGLTENVFSLEYKEAVRAKSAELGTSVSDVLDVAEMGPVDCASSLSKFAADIVVSFSGNPSLWTMNQQQVLSQSFDQTFRSLNGLNPDSCDLIFRDLSSVTIFRSDEFNRRMEEEASRNMAQRSLQGAETFSYLYRVAGNCRDCPPNTRLFAQASSGRQLLSQAMPLDGGVRYLQDDTCMCPVTASESRAPTDVEFRDAYGANLEILRQENSIDSAFIESIVDVKEVRQVGWGCGATETFETNVYVELSGTPSAVGENELEALELAFYNTYKHLAGNYCDPFFRTPVDIAIDTMTGIGRRVQSRSTFLYEYAVKGTCRGCPPNTRLFGESIGRLLASGETTMRHTRRDETFQENGLCFCSLVSIADRAPTQDEFAVAYNVTLKDLGLANIHHVVSVDEREYDDEVGDEIETGVHPPNSDTAAPHTDAIPEEFSTPPSLSWSEEEQSPSPAYVQPDDETLTGALEATFTPTCSPIEY